MICSQRSPRPPLRTTALLLLAHLFLPPDVGAQSAEGVPLYHDFLLEARALSGLKAEVATLVVGGGNGGVLPMAALALPSLARRRGEVQSVPVIFELEGGSLFAEAPEGQASVELYLYVMEPDGGVAGFFAGAVSIDGGQLGQVLYESGLKLVAHVDVPAGDYSFRFLAREPASGRFGLRTFDVEVGPPSAGTARLSPPLFGEPAARWLLARPRTRDLETERALDRLLPGLAVGPDGRLPAVLPVLNSEEVISFDALGFGEIDAAALVLELDPGEARGESVSVAVELADRRPAGDWERLRGTAELPDLAPGSYRIRLRVAESSTVSQRLEVVVLPPRDVVPEMIWAQIRHFMAARSAGGRGMARAAGGRSSGGLELPRGRRRDRRQMDPTVREAYRSVLESFVAGKTLTEVVGELTESETAIFMQDTDAGLERLRDTQLAVARSLGAAVGEGLLPLAVIHLEAYVRHRREGSYALATHSRFVAQSVAEMYAELMAEPEAEKTASTVLTCIAGDMSDSRLWKQSEEVLERALHYDGDNDEALLLLAVVKERFGEVAGVVDLMRRAVEVNPRAFEARLRLAVNLRRAGREGEAESTLRRLLRVEAEEWVLVLAYEELGALLASQERYEEAVTALRQGVSRFPGRQGLYVQLAYVLERVGRSPEGTSLLGRLPPGSSAAASPRYLYTQSRNPILRSQRDLLRRSVAVRAPMLGRALAEPSQGEG